MDFSTISRDPSHEYQASSSATSLRQEQRTFAHRRASVRVNPRVCFPVGMEDAVQYLEVVKYLLGFCIHPMRELPWDDSNTGGIPARANLSDMQRTRLSPRVLQWTTEGDAKASPLEANPVGACLRSDVELACRGVFSREHVET